MPLIRPVIMALKLRVALRFNPHENSVPASGVKILCEEREQKLSIRGFMFRPGSRYMGSPAHPEPIALNRVQHRDELLEIHRLHQK